MSWRDKLNQQAVTGGSQYSAGTVSSLRKRDLQERYDQAATNSSYSSETGNTQTSFMTPEEQSQPVTGNNVNPQPQTQPQSTQAVTNFSSNLKDTTKAYMEARQRANEASENARNIKLGTSAVAFALSPTTGALGWLGTMAGQAFGSKPDYDQYMDMENYERALGMYDVLNNPDYDKTPKVDLYGNPLSKKDYLNWAFTDYYKSGGTMDDAKRNDLLKKLGIDNATLGQELGYELPDLSNFNYQDWVNKGGQAVDTTPYKYKVDPIDIGGMAGVGLGGNMGSF